MNSTTTKAIHAEMTSQGARTTARPNSEKPSKFFAVLVVAFFNTAGPSILSSSCGHR